MARTPGRRRGALPAALRLRLAHAPAGVPAPWQTVYHHFRRWRRLDGRLRRAHDALRAEVVRAREGRARDPSAAVIDSQAVKTSRAGGPERGYDGAKRLAGRKRHVLVDTNGLVLAARVHGAGVPDRDGGRRLLAEGLGRELSRLELVWADGAYTGGLRRWAEEELGWRVEVPYHRDRQLAVEVRARGEAARLPGPAPALGGREDLRVVEPGSPSEQGLREAAGDGRGHDLRGDEPVDAAQAGASGVNSFTPAPPIGRLQNSF